MKTKSTVYLLSSILVFFLFTGNAPAWVFTNVFTGTLPGDGTGDPIYLAFEKLNADVNFLTNFWNGVPSNGVAGGSVINSVITNSLVTNSVIASTRMTGSTITNSALTNSTYAGNGYYVTNLNGTNLLAGTINTNDLSSSFMAFLAGLGGYPDISDGSGTVSFNNGVNLGMNGGTSTMSIIGATNDFNGNNYCIRFSSQDSGIEFDGYSAGANIPNVFNANGTDGNGWSDLFEGTGKAVFQNTGGFEMGSDLLIDVPGSSGGAFACLAGSNPGYTGINQPSPVYNLDVTGSFGDSSDGTYSMDSGGNLTCTSVTQTSDVNSKTNIVALDTSTVLARILATPVYKWNFRDRMVTNLLARITTNSVTKIHTTNYLARIRTNVLSNVSHIGPMAQDFAAQFGGKTNAISLIDMQGILLAGEQAMIQRLALDEVTISNLNVRVSTLEKK